MNAAAAVSAALFAAAAAFVLAVWLAYPLLLLVLNRLRPRRAASLPEPASGSAAKAEPPTTVSVLIAAHNEAAVIGARLANLAALDYPSADWEIIVAEDGSVDGTAAAARAAAAALAGARPGLRITVLDAPGRQGKAAALNRAAAAAAGAILVFSDANNLFAPDALQRLLAPFADPRAGAVAGWKTVAAGVGVGGGESVYWRFERWLMAQEDQRGWVVNAPGEILALRRECFRSLPAGTLLNDDLCLVLGVLHQGRRVAFAPQARSWEPPAATLPEEWRRRRRIAAGRWRALHAVPGRVPAAGPRFALRAHQIWRPWSAWAMALALLAGVAFAATAPGWAAANSAPRLIWDAVWLGVLAQFAFYALAALAAVASAAGGRLGRLEAAYFFAAAQAALLAGAWDARREGQAAHWAKPPRSLVPPPSAGHGETARAGVAAGMSWLRRALARPLLSLPLVLTRRHPPPSPAARADPPGSTEPSAFGPARRPAPPDPRIDRRAVTGNLAWAAASFGLGKLASLGSLVILARLLAPRDFGTVTVVLTAITFLEVGGRVGLNSALIFHDTHPDASGTPSGGEGIIPAAEVMFWFLLAASLGEAVVAWLAAPLLAGFFHAPLVTPMLRVLAPALVITALGATHDTLLRRTLSFQRKLIPDLGTASAKAAASIALAFAHWGAWALIGGQWCGVVAGTLLLWRVVGWRPRWRWRRDLARTLLAYGKHIYALEVSGIVLVNLDYLVVARILGKSALGFYFLAFRLPEALLISVLNIITSVVFPAFSRLQGDLPRLREAVVETERYAVLFALPVAAGLGLLARPLVLALYGRHWLPAVPIVQVLAIYAGLRCLSHHFGDAYKALGQPQILSALTLLWWVLLPPALIFGARWDGTVGVAWGQVATRAIMTTVHFFLIVHVAEIRPARLWRALAPAVEATAGLTLAILALRPFASALPPLLAFALLAAAGGAVYLLVLWLRHRDVCQTAILTARALLARRRVAETA